MEQPETQREQWGPAGIVSIAVGAFVVAVSIGLFMHTISQLASPLVCAAFIAGGIVGRRRARTAAAAAVSIGSIAGGLVAAVAGLALTAAGH